MVRTTTTLLFSVVIALAGCGDEDTSPGPDGGGGRDTGPGGGRDTGPSGGPPEASCDPVPLADTAGAVEAADEGALRTALAAGGTVVLTADIDATAPFMITAPTVFDGGGHTIDAGGRTHLFVTDRTDFTIQNVTLQNADNQVSDDEHFSNRSGAAVLAIGRRGGDPAPAGELIVNGVTFINNIIKPTGPGDLRGGALYGFNMPDITVVDSVFMNNQGSNGGAIGGLGSSYRIINTRFLDNATNGPGGSLEGHGGAISLDALSQNGETAYLSICGSEFRGNESLKGGGAIYLVTHWHTGSTVAIDQSVFADNRSSATDAGQGGAIYLQDDDGHEMNASNPNSASITDSLFTGNETWSRGGGLWYWTNEGHLTVTNTTFVQNQTYTDDTGMGGAVAISQGPADFINCTFAHNYAKFHGGGIQMGGDADVSLMNTLFYENLSNRDGGWANFHTNREVDTDRGGNMQFLTESSVIDSNSDALVSADAVRMDAMLGDLEDNGGPTWTMSLPAGSPAIDAGVSDGAPAADQRGMARDGMPDIGAFELQ